jgi:serine/threonine protein kinase
MAPEMFTVAPGATPDWNLKAIDIWALGVVYFTLLTGMPSDISWHGRW